MFLADIDGNVLVNPEYSSPIEFSEGLAPVLNDNKRSVLLTKQGQWLWNLFMTGLRPSMMV